MSKTEPAVNTDIISMFGLTNNQTKILFSIERLLIEKDIIESEKSKNLTIKESWLSNWENSVSTILSKSNDHSFLNQEQLLEAVKKETAYSNNLTWYYIVILEALCFVPYTSLGNDIDDKAYKKLKYNSKKCDDFLYSLLANQAILKVEDIKRIEKTFKKSYNSVSGKAKTIATKTFAVVAVASLAAALSAVFAGPIAVALFGSTFHGLYGAALTSACLAFAGGGAMAVGGTGIAGGIAFIAGGGALLGITGGSTATAIVSQLILKSPDFALTQAAKLETILKEVVLNTQQDIVSAQQILKQYEEQILELNKKLCSLELENSKNKTEIKNLQLTVKYVKKAYQNMQKFSSSYEEGIKAAEKING